MSPEAKKTFCFSFVILLLLLSCLHIFVLTHDKTPDEVLVLQNTFHKSDKRQKYIMKCQCRYWRYWCNYLLLTSIPFIWETSFFEPKNLLIRQSKTDGNIVWFRAEIQQTTCYSVDSTWSFHFVKIVLFVLKENNSPKIY